MSIIEFDTRKAKRFHIVIFDLETSGLETHHEVIQIGALKVTEDLNSHVCEPFELKVHMNDFAGASEEALKVNRYDSGVWAKEAVQPAVAAQRFAEWIVDGSDHVQFAGHNITGFDWPFLCRMFEGSDTQIMRLSKPRRWQDPEDEDDKGEFVKESMIPGSGYHLLLDTLPLAGALQLAVGQQELGSKSLRPLSRYCGFVHDADKGHEALYDCVATLHVLRWMKASLLTGAIEAKKRRADEAWRMALSRPLLVER
jgi:DNA polymerase III epsilon subunit-like protein